MKPLLASKCMNAAYHHLLNVTRRHFFESCGVGVGKIALSSLLAGSFAQRARGEQQASAAPTSQGSTHNPLAPKSPHYKPKATRVIHLFMAGAPSQLDLFDYKPQLTKFEGKPIPPEIIGGQRYAFIRSDAAA